MSTRITTADVTVDRDEVVEGQRIVVAAVRGRNRTFVVDHNTLWSSSWLCTCGNAPRCPHIRAVREVAKL